MLGNTKMLLEFPAIMQGQPVYLLLCELMVLGILDT